MNNAEIEIVEKAAILASLPDDVDKDAKLIQIANEVEPPNGAQKHADLLFSLAEKYNVPTDKYFVILEEHRQAYRQLQIDKIENKITEIVRLSERPDFDKLFIQLKEREELKRHSKAEMVNAGESLLKDIENLQAEAKKSVIKTGFSKLDEKLGGGLHNGRLYGLGGISSLGKTTLALNIAENIATDEKDKDGNITKAGRNVWIFSLRDG